MILVRCDKCHAAYNQETVPVCPICKPKVPEKLTGMPLKVEVERLRDTRDYLAEDIAHYRRIERIEGRIDQMIREIEWFRKQVQRGRSTKV